MGWSRWAKEAPSERLQQSQSHLNTGTRGPRATVRRGDTVARTEWWKTVGGAGADVHWASVPQLDHSGIQQHRAPSERGACRGERPWMPASSRGAGRDCSGDSRVPLSGLGTGALASTRRGATVLRWARGRTYNIPLWRVGTSEGYRWHLPRSASNAQYRTPIDPRPRQVESPGGLYCRCCTAPWGRSGGCATARRWG